MSFYDICKYKWGFFPFAKSGLVLVSTHQKCLSSDK